MPTSHVSSFITALFLLIKAYAVKVMTKEGEGSDFANPEDTKFQLH